MPARQACTLKSRVVSATVVTAALSMLATAAIAQNQQGQEVSAFIPVLVNSSTIPANGDLNPYGVAFVQEGFPSGGVLNVGDVLVSNFNNSKNVQGTGTTIIKLSPAGAIAPPGSATVFFSSSLSGLSTALGVLPEGGFVVVGNVPTTDGTFATIGQGALQVLDRNGKLLQTLTDAQFLDGPWDLTVTEQGAQAHIFVSNVLNGTVSRLDATEGPSNLTVTKKTTIANGYTHVPNAAAVILGPTGLAYDKDSDTLFVASTADNAIFSVSNASVATNAVARGTQVFAGSQLRGPLALRFAPNGHLLAANGDAVNADPEHPSEIVEFTVQGQFVRQYNVDASPGGAFGLDTVKDPDAPFNYAVINDVTSNLSVYRLAVQQQ